MASHGAVPPKLSKSGAVYIEKQLYVFGGVYETKDGRIECSHEMYSFNEDTGFWTCLEQADLQPCARAGHSMVSSGSILYVVCGWRGQSNAPIYLNDVFAYDTISSLWSPVRTAGIAPVARAFAGAVCHRGQLYLFGGCNGTLAHNFRNDMMLLDLATFCWTICVPSTSPPLGRSHHGMCAFGGRLYVFGGVHLVAGKRTALADLHEFDPRTRTWTNPTDTAAIAPPPRAGHGMCASHGGVFIYGGAAEDQAAAAAVALDCLWVYNPVSRLWHKLENRSRPIPPLPPSPPPCSPRTAIGCVPGLCRPS